MAAPHHVLITGGAGFIGSHLADVLLAEGHTVTVYDNLSPQVHGEAECDSDGWPVYLSPGVRRIRGDVLDADSFAAALDGVTRLVHLAASVGVGQSMTNIVDYTRNNTMGAATMLEVLSRRSHTVERIAVASSMSIYGEGAYRRLVDGALAMPPTRSAQQLRARAWDLRDGDGAALEPVPTGEDKLLQPTSIYAVNKRDHEEMFIAVGRALGIPTVALRLFNAYGSRQALANPYTGVCAIFIARLLNDQPPLVFEDGRQMRDFVHVRDVAQAFATVLASDAPVWDAFNVGSGTPIAIAELAQLLARLLGRNIAPELLGQYRVGDIRHCFADMGKFRATFGAAPPRDFTAGMAELVDWVGSVARPADHSARSLAELGAGRMLV